jgi:hypothetical protein
MVTSNILMIGKIMASRKYDNSNVTINLMQRNNVPHTGARFCIMHSHKEIEIFVKN